MVLRNNVHISDHVSSSILSNIKPYVQEVLTNSVWIVGTSEDIRLWNANWNGSSLVQLLNILSALTKTLIYSLKDMITHDNINVPL